MTRGEHFVRMLRLVGFAKVDLRESLDEFGGFTNTTGRTKREQ